MGVAQEVHIATLIGRLRHNLAQRGPEQRRDLLEIVEDRYDTGLLLITGQLPIERWYEIIGDTKLADGILDRIVHNAYRIELKGDSLRKRRAAEIVG